MEVMNAFRWPTHESPHAGRHRRVEIVTLASVTSIVALLAATFFHVVLGVHETPLVIGTILLASVVGWINAYLPDDGERTGDGGQAFDDVDDAWFEPAA